MAHRHSSRLVALLAGLALLACASGSPPSGRALPHAALPQREWREPVDFAALRMEFGERPDFFELCGRRPLPEVSALLEREDWPAIASLSRSWLNGCPIDLEFHAFASLALVELGDPTEAGYHAQWYQGLLNSILRSGDGLTSETAYLVVAVWEEYAVCRSLGYEVLGQTLTRDLRDKLRVGRGRESSDLYFNPEAHFRRLEAAPGEPD